MSDCEEAELSKRLKAELTAAFAAPATAYEKLDAETVIRRNLSDRGWRYRRDRAFR